MLITRAVLLQALILSSAASSSGCSWLFVEPVSKPHIAGDYANCTGNAAAPIVDTALAVGNAAAAIVLYGRHSAGTTGGAIGAGVTSGVWFSSALYGYSKTSECRDGNDQAESDEERRAPRGILRTPAPPPPPLYSPAPRKGAPLITTPPSTPTRPRQEDDDDEPNERRGPRPPAEQPNVPTSGA
jgi:hypothetical protein